MFNKWLRESGRTMVEALAVLAIMGVLTVGGIIGFKYAMEVNKENESIDWVVKTIVGSRTGFLLEQYGEKAEAGVVQRVPIAEVISGVPFNAAPGVQVSYSYTTPLESEVSVDVINKYAFEVDMTNVSYGVCTKLLNGPLEYQCAYKKNDRQAGEILPGDSKEKKDAFCEKIDPKKRTPFNPEGDESDVSPGDLRMCFSPSLRYCGGPSLPGTPVPPPVPPTSCEKDADCPSGECCLNNQCTPDCGGPGDTGGPEDTGGSEDTDVEEDDGCPSWLERCVDGTCRSNGLCELFGGGLIIGSSGDSGSGSGSGSGSSGSGSGGCCGPTGSPHDWKGCEVPLDDQGKVVPGYCQSKLDCGEDFDGICNSDCYCKPNADKIGYVPGCPENAPYFFCPEAYPVEDYGSRLCYENEDFGSILTSHIGGACCEHNAACPPGKSKTMIWCCGFAGKYQYYCDEGCKYCPKTISDLQNGKNWPTAVDFGVCCEVLGGKLANRQKCCAQGDETQDSDCCNAFGFKWVEGTCCTAWEDTNEACCKKLGNGVWENDVCGCPIDTVELSIPNMDSVMCCPVGAVLRKTWDKPAE